MRISDWSSDVCSSDLLPERLRQVGIAEILDHVEALAGQGARHEAAHRPGLVLRAEQVGKHVADLHAVSVNTEEAVAVRLRSEERRVGKEVSVRVDLGGRRSLKKKKEKI